MILKDNMLYIVFVEYYLVFLGFNNSLDGSNLIIKELIPLLFDNYLYSFDEISQRASFNSLVSSNGSVQFFLTAKLSSILLRLRLSNSQNSV
jgi:hypothetical protein